MPYDPSLSLSGDHSAIYLQPEMNGRLDRGTGWHAAAAVRLIGAWNPWIFRAPLLGSPQCWWCGRATERGQEAILLLLLPLISFPLPSFTSFSQRWLIATCLTWSDGWHALINAFILSLWDPLVCAYFGWRRPLETPAEDALIPAIVYQAPCSICWFRMVSCEMRRPLTCWQCYSILVYKILSNLV
jgi:hypothetical protein